MFYPKTNKLLLSLSLLLLPLTSAFAEMIPITIEHADTLEKHYWGLMQRAQLPKDHGMLFTYRPKQFTRIWMFNCLIDLSVAFLDENHVIREIHELKAYPEMMDPLRPVRNIHDLSKYGLNDPVFVFFNKNSVKSSFKISYALEMNKGWFEEHEVDVGSVLHFKPNEPKGFIEPIEDEED